MDQEFNENESLLRSVFPANTHPRFWKNGKLSSAALKDKKGLSVDRTYDRTIDDSIKFMRELKPRPSYIVSLAVSDCIDEDACLKYLPSQNNIYHSEIHGSESEIVLNDVQAFNLALKAKIQYEPEQEVK